MGAEKTNIQPWLHNEKWQQPLRSGAKTAVKFTWGIAIFWNLIALPVCFFIPAELGKENYLVLLVLLFPLIGIGLIRHAMKVTSEWRTFGITELQMDPYPGSIGGHVGGSITLNGLGHDLSAVRVHLEQIYSYMSGSGKNRSRKNKVEWQSAGPADILAQGGGKKMRFRFDVPTDLPVSEEKSGSSYRFWQLRIEGEGAVPLDRVFELPVFATGEQSQYIEVNTTEAGLIDARNVLDDATINPVSAKKLFDKYRLTLEHKDGWLRLYFHVGRQKAMAAILFLVGLAFFSVIIFLPSEGLSTGIFRWVFGLFGVPMMLASCYLPVNSLDVRVSRNKIVRERRWLGLRVKRQEVQPSELSQIEIADGASTTSGNKTTQFYRLIGKGAFGKIRLAENISDKALIIAMRDEIMGVAGLHKE